MRFFHFFCERTRLRMRLDKYLAEAGLGSRKEVKQIIRKKKVTVNLQLAKNDKLQIDENKAEVRVDGQLISYQKYFYYMLNKPAGFITATQDNHQKTVMDLMNKDQLRNDLFPVGRLDKDTEGLILITNDGPFSHQLLSPKKHVEKEYYAKIAGIITADDVKKFEQGIQLNQEEKALPAILTILSVDKENTTSEISLIIYEGKFHQVKRMIKAVGKEVCYLKRTRMGNLSLPVDLTVGNYKELSEKELVQLKIKGSSR